MSVMKEKRICAFRFCNNEIPEDARSNKVFCCKEHAVAENFHARKAYEANIIDTYEPLMTEQKESRQQPKHSIDELSIAAKASGMTYGEYVARMDGRIR
jgi:hypothetical protein